MKVLVTGSGGFVAGYLIPELLGRGHDVVGLDNFVRYGRVSRSFDGHPKFRQNEGDAKDADRLKTLLADCDHFVAGAGLVGGIAYAHDYPYDIFVENERLTLAAFEAARAAPRLRKITVISSSMVYECASTFPSSEGEELRCPPPRTTYAFQKLAFEYLARAAQRQHGLPFTILRLINAVGIGESRSLTVRETPSGNLKLAMSHVINDLTQKILRDPGPVRLLGDGAQVRHFTYAGDLARGIAISLDHPRALNEDFNLSTASPTTILQLAEILWKRLRPNEPFRHASEAPLPFDVRRNSPDVSKAKTLLGFEATTPLDAVLDETVPWIREQIRAGRL